MSAIIGVALLHVLIGLLLLPLFALLFGLPVLPRAANTTDDAAGNTTDGRPFAGTFAAAGNAPDNRTAGTAEDATCQCPAAHALLFL